MDKACMYPGTAQFTCADSIFDIFNRGINAYTQCELVLLTSLT